MCKLCDEGKPQDHSGSRRDFLKAATATGAAAGLNLFAARPAAARGDDDDDRRDPPEDSGRRGRRYIIRGGAVMSMDPKVGEFPQADVLVEGKKILAVGPNLHAGGAAEIDARGRIVMPGFIDTHHHQFETALRSFLADGVLINDGSGSPSGSTTYFEFILLKFAPVYRPQDVYINELFGGLEPARRRRHHGARRLADPSLAAALGRRDQGAVRHRAPRRLRLFRERGCRHSRHQSRQPVSDRRAPHQEAVVLLERPARPHDHGRRGLSWGCDDRRVLDDRAAARPPDRGAYPLAVRHPADL